MIDWKRLAELRDEVGADDFQEVVTLFLEEVDEVIARLRAAPDPGRFEADLHFLKGGALNLGFQKFSHQCQIGEAQAAGGDPGAVDLQAVLSAYDDSRTMFLGRLRDELGEVRLTG